MKKIILIIMVLLIVPGLLAGCSKNPVTGKYGPAWDVTLKLPVVGGTKTLGDVVGAGDFNTVGYTIDTSTNEFQSFFYRWD